MPDPFTGENSGAKAATAGVADLLHITPRRLISVSVSSASASIATVGFFVRPGLSYREALMRTISNETTAPIAAP